MKIKRSLFALLISIMILSGATPYAFGWANGNNHGNGYGTHDWILDEANRIAGLEVKGGGWVNLKIALPATDDPDSINKNFTYHVYDIWGKKYGKAPEKIAKLYADAVSYEKKGEISNASKMVGLLAHYYGDICNPLHADQCATEDKIHSRYESAVNTRTNTKGENEAWVKADGYTQVKDITMESTAAATFAHQDYQSLVDNYNKSSFNSAVEDITKRSLNHAVNDLADIIISIKVDAGK